MIKKAHIANIVIAVMVVGLVGGLIIAGLFLDILEFHPDFSFTPSVWLLGSGLIAWAALFFWTIGSLIAKCAGKTIPPYQIRLVVGWLVGLMILFMGGMLLPRVTRWTPRSFARGCGTHVGEYVRQWSAHIADEKYSDLSMAEIYTRWLKPLPQSERHTWTPDEWREELEYYLTVRDYRKRKDVKRMPVENDFVYVYCGKGVDLHDFEKIIFYEKPGMHRRGGNFRNIIYADGRAEAISPEKWPEVAAAIEKQTGRKLTTP